MRVQSVPVPRALSGGERETSAKSSDAGDEDGGWACRTASNIETRIPLGLRDYGVIALAGLAGFTFAFWLACH